MTAPPSLPVSPGCSCRQFCAFALFLALVCGSTAFAADWCKVEVPADWEQEDDQHLEGRHFNQQLHLSSSDASAHINIQHWSPRIDNPTWDYARQTVRNLNSLGEFKTRIYETIEPRTRLIAGQERTSYSLDIRTHNPEHGDIDWTWEVYRIDYDGFQVFIIVSYQDSVHVLYEDRIQSILQSLNFNPAAEKSTDA